MCAPLQVVLRNDLIELLLNQICIFRDPFQGPVDIVGPDRGAGCNGVVYGDANVEIVFVGVLKGGARLLLARLLSTVRRRTAWVR